MEIRPESSIKLKVASAFVALLAFARGMIWAVDFKHELLDFNKSLAKDIEGVRYEVKSLSDKTWTISDQLDWAYDLDEVNRKSSSPIAVPRPRRATSPEPTVIRH